MNIIDPDELQMAAEPDQSAQSPSQAAPPQSRVAAELDARRQKYLDEFEPAKIDHGERDKAHWRRYWIITGAIVLFTLFVAFSIHGSIIRGGPGFFAYCCYLLLYGGMLFAMHKYELNLIVHGVMMGFINIVYFGVGTGVFGWRGNMIWMVAIFVVLFPLGIGIGHMFRWREARD